MLIESDIFIAHMKKKDWLKPVAETIIKAIQDNQLDNIQASTAVIHELYYVFSEMAPVSTTLMNAAKTEQPASRPLEG